MADAAPILRLAPFLDGLVERLHRPDLIREDPLAFPRRFREPGDREVVALLAALLAWGRVQQIAGVLERLLARLGPHPHDTLLSAAPRDLRRLTRGIVHRTATEDDLARMLGRFRAALRRHGSLRALFLAGLKDSDATVLPALHRFVDGLCGPCDGDSPGLAHLFARPGRGSACKRWMLFLRWVARPDDGVDLGLWPEVSPARLVIPLDTHIFRIARNLHLTRRRTPDLRTALEITEALRAWRPEDPVGCDFALSRLGIHRECPPRVDVSVCAGCGLRSVCRHGVGL